MESLRRSVKNWRYFPEPVQLIYVLTFSICIVPKDKIYIDKVCNLDMLSYLSDRNLTTQVCDYMSKNKTYEEIEKETQRRVSELKVYEGLILNLPSIAFALVAGSLTDSVGRTIFMTIPFIGNVLGTLWLMVTVYWWDTFPPQYLLISGIEGLFGCYMVMNMGLYSYIADTTSPQDRTTRMSWLTGIFSLGYVIGVQLGGRVKSYLTIFGISAALGIFGIIYTTFILKESFKKPDKDLTGKTDGTKTRSILSILLDSLLVVGKQRPGFTRMLAAMAIFQFLSFMLCINTQEYDYLMTRLKFHWEMKDFSNYLTVQRVCRLTGLFLFLPLVSKVLKISDNIIVAIGCLISLLSYCLLTVGSPSWGGSWPVYLAAATQLNSITTVSIRSILSKLFDPEEIGKVFAVLGIGQAVVALLAHSLLGVIYNKTLDMYASMYLVPVDILLAISLFTSIFSLFLHRKQI